MRDVRKTQLDRLSHGHPDDELIHALEPDQVVAAASRPLPRYQLSSAGNVALFVEFRALVEQRLRLRLVLRIAN